MESRGNPSLSANNTFSDFLFVWHSQKVTNEQVFAQVSSLYLHFLVTENSQVRSSKYAGEPNQLFWSIACLKQHRLLTPFLEEARQDLLVHLVHPIEPNARLALYI